MSTTPARRRLRIRNPDHGHPAMIYVEPDGTARAIHIDVETPYPSLEALLRDHGLTEQDLEDVLYGA